MGLWPTPHPSLSLPKGMVMPLSTCIIEHTSVSGRLLKNEIAFLPSPRRAQPTGFRAKPDNEGEARGLHRGKNWKADNPCSHATSISSFLLFHSSSSFLRPPPHFSLSFHLPPPLLHEGSRSFACHHEANGGRISSTDLHIPYTQPTHAYILAYSVFHSNQALSHSTPIRMHKATLLHSLGESCERRCTSEKHCSTRYRYMHINLILTCSFLCCIKVGLFLRFGYVLLVPDPLIAKPVGYLKKKDGTEGEERIEGRTPRMVGREERTRRCH